MSLLLQALQKAATNRSDEAGERAAAESGNRSDLTLEPLAEPQLRNSADPDAQQTASTPSPEDAASVMQAGDTPSYSALDWARDHYMLSFLAFAILFVIFYGLYVYIQVANPAMFRSSPPQTAPLQTAVVVPPAATRTNGPARISGLPDAGTPATTANEMIPFESGENVSRDNAFTGTTAAENSATPANDPRARASAIQAPQPAPATRPNPTRNSSTTARQVAARTDSDGVEVIEIPAPPTVSAVPELQGAPGDNISVRKQRAGASPIDTMLLAAYDAMQQGEYQKAGKLYKQVLVQDSNSVDALLGLAAIAWKQGRTNSASQRYGRVLELDPRNTYAQAGLIALLGNADPVAAESKLKQLIEREPTGFLYFTLGNLYAAQRNWSRAQAAYFKAYQFEPDNSDYAFNLAVGLEHLGQVQPALQYYRIALNLSFAKGRANFDQRLAIERVGQLSARVD